MSTEDNKEPEKAPSQEHQFVEVAEKFLALVVEERKAKGKPAAQGAHKAWKTNEKTAEAGGDDKPEDKDHDGKPDVKPLLKRGAKGKSVRQLQTWLTSAGDETEIDGDYGPKTEKAVKKFQKSHKLTVNGECDIATWTLLITSFVTKTMNTAVANAKKNAGKAKGDGKGADGDGDDEGDEAEAEGGTTPEQAAKHVEQAKSHAGGDAKDADDAGDKHDKPKAPPGSKGFHKTKDAKDLVETYGTVAEAGDQQGHVNVYWVDGLNYEKRYSQKKKKWVKDFTGEKDQAELDAIEKPNTGQMSCHKKIQPLFQQIFDEILANGDWNHILQKPGCHVPRENRNNSVEWSIHSWGTAIDVNAETNPNKTGPKGGTSHQKAIQHYFTEKGFTWLADKDAMHFQYHDGSAPKISDKDIGDIAAGKVGGLSDPVNSLKKDIKINLDVIAATEKKQGYLGPKTKKRRERLLEMLALLG